MALSKRLRYEVLRRDGFACRYCGAMAPDARLTVDHVIPSSLGGRDEPSNLVTACADCNAGKSATPSDATVVADVEADALRWAEAMRAAQEILVERQQEDAAVVAAFLGVWDEFMPSADLPMDFGDSVIGFHRSGLPVEVIREAAFIAVGAEHVAVRQRFRYFAGVCRRKIEELHDLAQQMVGEDRT